MSNLSNTVSQQLQNPHDAAAVMAALKPVILFGVLIIVGIVFVFVVKSAGKAGNGSPPKEKP